MVNAPLATPIAMAPAPCAAAMSSGVSPTTQVCRGSTGRPSTAPARWMPSRVSSVRSGAQPLGRHLGQLARAGVVADHGCEGQPPDLGIGHAGGGELTDVGGDPVEIGERPAPGNRAGAAGRDQRAVDVEQDRDDAQLHNDRA